MSRDINPQHKKAILQNVCNTSSGTGHMISVTFTIEQSECVTFLKHNIDTAILCLLKFKQKWLRERGELNGYKHRAVLLLHSFSVFI